MFEDKISVCQSHLTPSILIHSACIYSKVNPDPEARVEEPLDTAACWAVKDCSKSDWCGGRNVVFVTRVGPGRDSCVTPAKSRVGF